MNATRAWHTATLLANGKVLIDGGGDGDSEPNAELYDPVAGAFTATGPPMGPGYLIPGSASLLPNGEVLETLAPPEDFGKQAGLYDPTAGTLTATANMTTDRGYRTATLLPDGKVLTDGRDETHFGGSSELYDPVTGSFIATTGMFPQSEEGHTATLLPDGSVLLAGGWICCGFSVANAELYTPMMPAPAAVLYSLPGGTQGAILHGEAQQVVSPSNPAAAGEAIEIYGAGLIEGSVIQPQVAIGGQLAALLFFGDAPGYPGVNQINVRLPDGVAPGAAVSIRLDLSQPPEQCSHRGNSLRFSDAELRNDGSESDGGRVARG
jgi:hypothetical protein